MTNNVKRFNELTTELQVFAGGKGSMLARMYQDGYPVPDGFVILPDAFKGEVLSDEAWDKVIIHLNDIRKSYEDALFAVRSSALSEDSAQASFAGEFESVLSVKDDKDIMQAIYTVFRSRESERVKAYSTVQGMNQTHQIAVVIQLMVQSEISGILFTADPITGSYESMIGNYVYGLGEQLVAGESNALDFKLIRPKGKYEGPDELSVHGPNLYKLAAKLEKKLGTPQDIEWAVSKEKLYILQSRPITTLSGGNLDTYDMNYSYMGDELWINTNVAEAIPDVYSPFTWSIGRLLDQALNFIPGYYIFSGNICGRPYMNISRRLSVMKSVLGKYSKGAIKMITDIYGEFPEYVNMPHRPFSRLEVLKEMIPIIMSTSRSSIKASKGLSEFLKATPEQCSKVRNDIQEVKTKEELLSIWYKELKPYFLKAWISAGAAAIKMTNITSLDKKLSKLIGTEDTNILLSNLRGGGSGLESLGPVIGISKVIKGEMSREEYLSKYGHRGAHEYEMSIPDPMEDTDWLEKQIALSKRSNIDVEELLSKQYKKYEDAKSKFSKNFPDKTQWLERQLEKAANGAQLREEGRSEFVRIFRVVRTFALKAGELSGIGDDIFFLYINEVEDLLSIGTSKTLFIPKRKENYEKYKALPPFPSIIRGRFNPVEWAKDPNRRLDYYDATMPLDNTPDIITLKGFAGAAGRIEGIVRILLDSEEGEKLLPGEILVAVTTNIGWTPLFPKAGAIITDIGAPLSHAAIVARELGIPAVVGCGNATTRLKTGDRVIVDGGHGIVHILE